MRACTAYVHLLQFWRSEVQAPSHWAGIKVPAGWLLLEAPGKNLSLARQPEQAAHSPWPLAGPQRAPTSAPSVTPPLLILTPLPPPPAGHFDPSGPSL